jgi:serine/threonine protein kinase
MDLIGRQLGNHRIVSLIGEGGMGVVYLAEHTVLGRSAAIKVLHERSYAGGAAVARFFDEARAANRVKHPGIVDIYDCGQDEKIGPYLVMEHLEGESLGARLRRGQPLPVAEAARIAVEVADVLEAVHGQKIVHRDLKPDNIFLLADGRIKVLDFGVALLASRPGGSGRLTGAFQVLGTPHYMSPEQCAWSANVDRRTDVYALGVITYEMLVGAPPFEHRDHNRIQEMHQHETPPPPSLLNPAVDEATEAVVLRALAKQPSARFPTAGEFAAALARATGVELPRRPEVAPAEPEPELRERPTPRDTLRDAATPDDARRGPAHCPHCPEQLMSPVTLGAVEVDLCPLCRGVWFDLGEETEVARQSLGENGPLREIIAELGQRLKVVAMRCPCCDEPLVAYRFAQFDGLEAELCELCGGLWLEHGELAQVQRSRAHEIVRQLAARGGT